MTDIQTPNASYGLTIRVKIQNLPGKLGEITTAIGRTGGDIGAIDIVSVGKDFLVRDLTVNTYSEQHDEEILKVVRAIDGVEVLHSSDLTFLNSSWRQNRNCFKNPFKNTRRSFDGIHARSRQSLRSNSQRPGKSIHADDQKKHRRRRIRRHGGFGFGRHRRGGGDAGDGGQMSTYSKNSAALTLFRFALNTKDPHEIIETIKNISVGFGGINLEDISAHRDVLKSKIA